MTGTLYLVGVGPGDPELLTLKAARILGEVDIVAYPQKAGQDSLALSIAQAHVNPAAAHLPFDIPMTTERAPAQGAYDTAASSLMDALQAGKSIAYLCEGDPLFYGSAMYLIPRMAPAAKIIIVPGVTSLTASAAAIGRPLAARNEVLKILPAPLDNDSLSLELAGADAVAIIKVGAHFDRIRQLLAASGHAKGAMVIEHASGAKQKIAPLADFPANSRPYFSTILCYRGGEAWGQ